MPISSSAAKSKYLEEDSTHNHLKEIATANTTVDMKVLTPPGDEIKTVLSKLYDNPLLNIQNRYIDEVSLYIGR